jgi:hypothetical protein
VTREIQEPNIDIADGNSRPLKLDAPPFGLSVAESATYLNLMAKEPKYIIYVKQIVVWHNDQAATI